MFISWYKHTNDESDKDNPDSKKYHSKRNIQASSRSEGKALDGEFWAKGYYVNTVGRHGNENTIQAYVKA